MERVTSGPLVTEGALGGTTTLARSKVPPSQDSHNPEQHDRPERLEGAGQHAEESGQTTGLRDDLVVQLEQDRKPDDADTVHR